MSPTLKLRVVKHKPLPANGVAKARECVIVRATVEDDFSARPTFPSNVFVSNEELGKLCGPCDATISLVCIYDAVATLRITVQWATEETIMKIHDRIIAFFKDPSVILDYEDNPVIVEREKG